MESGPIHLDHIIVAARTLDEGAAWVAARLGARPAGGGKHTAMGTHNRLLSLGPGAYLEVIAIDPDAPAPARPRWFSLDTPAMSERLARSPALIHWVARTDDIERDLRPWTGDRVDVLEMQRGDFRWRIAVAADGLLRDEGTRPTLIQWLGPSPAGVLPDVGIRLERLLLRHERASHTLDTLGRAGLGPRGSVQAAAKGPALRAELQTSSGAPAGLPE